MTHDDRIQATAIITLLAALFGALWALQRGLAPQAVALTAGLAYGAALALTSPLQAPLGACVITSIKYAAITAAYAVWIAAAGAYAVWKLLRGRRAGTGVFV